MKKLNAFSQPSLLALFGFLTVMIWFSGTAFGDEAETEIENGSILVQQIYDYPHLAKINMNDAMDIALAKISGDILKAELDKENGFLVYEILVATPERTISEITVDAGNGQILLVEEEDGDDSIESNCQ
jgi:hypothetical protein